MTYTIGTERNAYFNGRDAVLFDDGERVATLALKSDMPAVEVKVYEWGTNATKQLREELDEDELEGVIERVQMTFWEADAPEIAREHGYQNVYQEGRSGGWCVPYPAPNWWDTISIDAKQQPADEGEEEAFVLRERYFNFAKAITAQVEELRTSYFDELLEDEHAEVMATRARLTVEREARERREKATAKLTRSQLVLAVTTLATNELPREELERILNTYGEDITE